MDESKDKELIFSSTLQPESSFEGISQYRQPLCFELSGKFFDFIFDDKRELLVEFKDKQNVSITEDGQTEGHKYEALKCRDLIYLVLIEKKGRKPREGIIFVIDLEQYLVTGNFLTQGAVEGYERLVVRDLTFGRIARPGAPITAKRHEYTKDLIGKKIEYTYSPYFSIIHIYREKDCRVANTEMMKKRGLSSVPMDKFFEEPCIYIKITDGVYVFSWIESNYGSGTQGFMLMDTDRTHDVGCFFGVAPDGKPECYLVSAVGKYVTERLPEEDIPPEL